MANFNFIDASEFGAIKAHAQAAEKYVLTDPRASVIYSRLCLEYAIYWLFENDEDLPKLGKLKYDYNRFLSLDELMNLQEFIDLVDDQDLYASLFDIKRIGNKAVHKNQESITKEHALSTVELLYNFLLQLAIYYQEPEPEIVPFDVKKLPAGVAAVSARELQKLKEAAGNLEDELKDLQEQKMLVSDEIETLKREREKFRKRRLENAQKAQLHPSQWTEDETRFRLIDVLLMEAGWDPDEESVREYKVVQLPTTVFPSGTGKADYVLWDDDGKPLAVIEAKKTIHNPNNGRYQAKLYADGLEAMFGQRPVIFYTNGFQTWLWDDTFYPQRKVMGFYSKEELRLSIHRRANRKHLLDIVPNTNIVGGQGRAYQLEAVNRTCSRYCDINELKGSHRKALLVMATGAGKTRTAAAIIEILAKANWAKRVLFLADRTALVSQAKGDISSYLPGYSCKDITKEVDDDSTRIVFSTYQTIINRIEGGDRQYSLGHFDLIIIDEAHRSIYSKYRSIFNYFDSLLLGLTATPKGEVDRDTFEFFDCSPGEPTYSYDLYEAEADGHLFLPKGKQVDFGFIRSGIRYSNLSDEEKKKYEETFTDEFGHVPEEINASAMNDWLYNEDTIKKVLEYLMVNGIKVADKIGKTIIFAKNRHHAEMIQEIFVKQYPQYGGHFCQTIHYKTEKAEDLIDKFKIPGRLPRIAVSVDMLDTGINVPEIVNLVLFKPVYSKSKYWQMVGRGTRRSEDLFGPGVDKKEFYLFDFCGNFDFFDQNPEGLPANAPESLSTLIFKSWLDLVFMLKEEPHDKDEDMVSYRSELLDRLHFEVSKLYQNKNNISVRRVLEQVIIYADRYSWNHLSLADKSIILEQIAPIVEITEPDQYAKRFDNLIHKVQIALIQGDPDFEEFKTRIIMTADALKQISNVPEVQTRINRIKQLLTDVFWEAVSILDLEKIRGELRDLIQHIRKDRKRIYHTNFTDSIVYEGDVDFTIANLANRTHYKRRLEQLIEANTSHIAVHNLRANKPITRAELESLKDILLNNIEEQGKEDFEAFLNKQSLGLTIRNLLGLDENAAKMAFAEFERKAGLTDIQMRFLQEIVNSLRVNGIVDTGKLYDGRPFKAIHSKGIEGVFTNGDLDEVFEIVKRVNDNAVA